MRVIKKVVTIGDSIGIIFDKLILETMKIELGDKIVVDIVKKIKKEKK